MKKNNMLALLFLASFSTFALSQDVAHTPFSIDYDTYQSFDSRSVEKLIAENPSLSNRWNLEPGLVWNNKTMAYENKTIVFPSNRVYPVDNYELFMQEREQNINMSINPLNLNNVESRPFTGLLNLPLRSFAANLNLNIN